MATIVEFSGGPALGRLTARAICRFAPLLLLAPVPALLDRAGVSIARPFRAGSCKSDGPSAPGLLRRRATVAVMNLIVAPFFATLRKSRAAGPFPLLDEPHLTNR